MWFPILLNGTLWIAIVHTKGKKKSYFQTVFIPLLPSNYLLITLTNHIVSTFKRCHKFGHSLQPTPLFLLKKIPWTEEPGRLLAGYSLWGHKELDMTEWTHTHTHTHTHTYFVSNLLRAFFFSFFIHERILDFYEQHKGEAKKNFPFVIASKRIK